jgi:hypothetical protein
MMRKLFPRCWWLLNTAGYSEPDISRRLLDARRGDRVQLLVLRTLAQTWRRTEKMWACMEELALEEEVQAD